MALFRHFFRIESMLLHISRELIPRSMLFKTDDISVVLLLACDQAHVGGALFATENIREFLGGC